MEREGTMSQMGAQRDESWVYCKEPMPGRDQLKHMKHKSKPTGEGQGLGICHFGRGIREGLLREVSFELGHKGASNQRISNVSGKARKLTNLAGAEGGKHLGEKSPDLVGHISHETGARPGLYVLRRGWRMAEGDSS